MADSMGPPWLKGKPGNTHKFFIRWFCFATRPGAARVAACKPAKPLIRFGFTDFWDRMMLRCNKKAPGFRGKRFHWRTFHHTVV
jgi:hypothetical protein